MGLVGMFVCLMAFYYSLAVLAFGSRGFLIRVTEDAVTTFYLRIMLSFGVDERVMWMAGVSVA
jgi:hypothetical protein